MQKGNNVINVEDISVLAVASGYYIGKIMIRDVSKANSRFGTKMNQTRTKIHCAQFREIGAFLSPSAFHKRQAALHEETILVASLSTTSGPPISHG